MNTKTVSNRALSVIDQYFHFRIANAICSVPYFNNKKARLRNALNARIGKGSPKEIFDETEVIIIKYHISTEQLTGEILKKIMTDDNIGIDCSGFAYYILNAESQERGAGSIDRHLSFIQSTGIISKLTSALRPARSVGVKTFAHDKNSRLISIKDTLPGDMITMLEDDRGDENEHDHILVIHQIEYQNFIPYKLHYSHAVAYPEDGVYGTGIKQGIIDIIDINKPISEQIWTENGLQGSTNRIFVRANKSKTELRRLKWW